MRYILYPITPKREKTIYKVEKIPQAPPIIIKIMVPIFIIFIIPFIHSVILIKRSIIKPTLNISHMLCEKAYALYGHKNSVCL